MVSREIIEQIITKCHPTIADMKTTLSHMSQSEKDAILTGKMNPAEAREYKMYKEFLNDTLLSIESIENNENSAYRKGGEFHKELLRRVDHYNEIIFQYERRIIEDYSVKEKPVPQVDIGNFVDDTDYGSGVSITPNPIESRQVELQRQNTEYSDANVNALAYWFGSGHEEINDSTFKNRYWQSMSVEEKKEKNKLLTPIKQQLTNAINKSEGLEQDTVLFYGGRFDIHLNAGDTVKFKGYTSFSFNKKSAEKFTGMGFLYKCLTPAGAKGVCGNTDQLKNNHKIEHEFLRGKGLEGKIVSIDYANREVYVLMDE